MKWSNLKYNKCPVCGSALNSVKRIVCSSGKCTFKISEKKMLDIVMDMNKQSVLSMQMGEEQQNEQLMSEL